MLIITKDGIRVIGGGTAPIWRTAKKCRDGWELGFGSEFYCLAGPGYGQEPAVRIPTKEKHE